MNPDSTDPTLGDEPLEADLPGWNPPSRPSLDPLDPAVTTVSELPPAIPEAPSFGRDEGADEPPAPTSPKTETTSPRSAGDPSIASAAAGLFALGATILGFVVDATIGHKSGAYRMRESEAEAIGEPLGRMAARRATIGDGEAQDVGDGIQAGVATAAYAARATMEHFGAPDPAEGPS